MALLIDTRPETKQVFVDILSSIHNTDNLLYVCCRRRRRIHQLEEDTVHKFMWWKVSEILIKEFDEEMVVYSRAPRDDQKVVPSCPIPSCLKIVVSSKTTRYSRWNAAFIGGNALSRKFTNDPSWNQTCFTHLHRFSQITHECPWFQAFRIDFHRCFCYINVHRWSAHIVHMFSSVMQQHRWSSVIVRIHHAWKSVSSEPSGSPVVSTVFQAWSLIIRCHHPTAKARLLLMWLYQFLLVSTCSHTSVL